MSFSSYVLFSVMALPSFSFLFHFIFFNYFIYLFIFTKGLMRTMAGEETSASFPLVVGGVVLSERSTISIAEGLT